MDEFELAVLVSYNSTTHEEQTKAIAYCNQVKEAPNGWAFCLEKFFLSARLEVKFYCLVVIQEFILHKWLALSPSDQNTLKDSLFRWLREYVPKTVQDTSIKNKFAQTLALLFKIEFPLHWPTFFSELFSCLQLGLPLIDMLLRIMKSIDEEVISKEIQRSAAEVATSNEIKDFMRQQVVQDLANTWFEILNTYYAIQPDVCKDCLDNVKRYISWTDINLFMNDKFVPLFYKFLSNEQLQEEACECLYELVSKGMADPMSKLGLLNKLKIMEVLNTISMDSDGDFLESVAKIVNTIGIEIISCIAKIEILVTQHQAPPEALSKASMMLEEALSLLFKFMNNEDDEVSHVTFGFANNYLASLKNAQFTEKQLEHLNMFLQIVRNKTKYPPTYNFNKPDEDEAEFCKYREEMSTIFRGIVKLNPQMVANFVHSTIEAVINNLNSASFSDVEVALYLLQTMGDGISGATITNLEIYFAQETAILALSNISTYPHQAVTLTYFDVITRYARYLPNNPEVFKHILVSFLDGRGLRHPVATVRSRCCYLFFRFIKTKMVHLFSFIDSILESLKDFLLVSLEVQKIISFEDQINLYEAIGSLIGSQPHTVDSQPVYTVVQPLIKQMEEILSLELYKSDSPDHPVYTTILAQIINNIGSFSKGFNNQSGPIFKSTLIDIIKMLQVIPNNEEIRAKVIFFMHRMITCLGADVLEFLPTIIGQLMTNCGVRDLLGFIKLINQLISKFKDQMFPVIDSLLLRLIERIFGILRELSLPETRTTPGTKSEAEREILEVQKNYYQLLSSIVSNNLSNTLTSPANVGSIPDILKTIMEGCREYRDVSVPKQAYAIIKKLVEQWSGTNGVKGFNNFVYEQVAPLLIKQPFSPEFNLSDGEISVLFTDIVSIQKTIMTQCGREFFDYLQNILLPSLQFSPELSHEYAVNLENLNVKEFKNYVSELVSKQKNRKT